MFTGGITLRPDNTLGNLKYSNTSPKSDPCATSRSTVDWEGSGTPKLHVASREGVTF